MAWELLTGKLELVKYFKETNQIFLAKYEFPTHNQFLDYLLKFGILGPIVVVFYIGLIAFLGFKTKNAVIISFFFLFFTSNLTDDFLLRFDGIVFSGLWISIFRQLLVATKEQAHCCVIFFSIIKKTAYLAVLITSFLNSKCG